MCNNITYIFLSEAFQASKLTMTTMPYLIVNIKRDYTAEKKFINIYYISTLNKLLSTYIIELFLSVYDNRSSEFKFTQHCWRYMHEADRLLVTMYKCITMYK